MATKDELEKEARKLRARLLRIQLDASEIAAAAENGSPEIAAANLAEEAVQHALRLIEIGG